MYSVMSASQGSMHTCIINIAHHLGWPWCSSGFIPVFLSSLMPQISTGCSMHLTLLPTAGYWACMPSVDSSHQVICPCASQQLFQLLG